MPQLCKGPAQQARDVHLRDPHAVGDLRLREALEEPQVEDLTLALRELLHLRRQRGSILEVLEMLVLLAQVVGEGGRSTLLGLNGRVERGEVVRLCDLQTFQHALLAYPGGLGDLLDRRRTAQLLAQVTDRLRQLEVQLLESPRYPNCPPLVAEVALELSDDGRCRVRRELDFPLEVEPLDRLQQTNSADLDEVLKQRAAVAKAPREELHQPNVLIDKHLPVLEPRGLVGGPPVGDEEVPHLVSRQGGALVHVRLFLTRLKAGVPFVLSSVAESTTVSRITRENSVRSVLIFWPGARSPVPVISIRSSVTVKR